MLRALFETCDCQPHYVFNFLKMYSAPTKDRKALDIVADETQARLQSVKANPSLPMYLEAWLMTLWVDPKTSYRVCLSNKSYPFHHAAASHSFAEWRKYWMTWRNTLRNGWKSGEQLDSKQVFPEVYADYNAESGTSLSYDRDFKALVAMHVPEVRRNCWPGTLTDEDIEFIDEFLDEQVSQTLSEITNSEDDGVIRHWTSADAFSGIFVGEVQHLPKKGGGTDYRDIAVPNRFIQAALEPIADKLYHLLHGLPKDATFNQERFDTVLVNRVSNDSLYQGSVDLSKATDNLPRKWGEAIVESLMTHIDLSPEERLLQRIYGNESVAAELQEDAEKSWTLFKHVSGANWLDGGKVVDHWKVGQPLGSLPSFALLGITHNLYVEAMGCSLGLLHSPYVTLGDDIVIFNAKLRKKYIREMTSRSIPLSLQKSYEGQLSEFAGKLYVKNCVPFHCSDHNPLTWNSLFDYQRATGIRIPWEYLPRQLKRHYRKIIANECKKDGLPSNQVMQTVDSTYKLILTCEIGSRGSSQYPAIPDNWVNSGVIARFFEGLAQEDYLTPESVPHSGITVIKGSPVKLLSDSYANKDGWFLRFRPVELPSWYKTKFRPCTTDKAILAAYAALRTTV
jgi:hypothetical protein